MAKQTVSVGSAANDGTGDTLRSGGGKINANFDEIYTKLGNGSTLNSNTFVTNADTQTLTNKTVNLSNNTLTGTTAQFNTANSDDDFATLANTVTLTNKTLTSPKIVTAINDLNGNEVISITGTGSAVNHLLVYNNSTTNPPGIMATGSATNLHIALLPKGTGSVNPTKLAFGSSTITANGAASTSASYIIGNKGSALAVSMADGTKAGEYKIFTNKGAGVMTVTPNAFAQGTSFALAQYDGCTCIWDGSNWYLVGNQGEITIA